MKTVISNSAHTKLYRNAIMTYADKNHHRKRITKDSIRMALSITVNLFDSGRLYDISQWLLFTQLNVSYMIIITLLQLTRVSKIYHGVTMC